MVAPPAGPAGPQAAGAARSRSLTGSGSAAGDGNGGSDALRRAPGGSLLTASTARQLIRTSWVMRPLAREHAGLRTHGSKHTSCLLAPASRGPSVPRKSACTAWASFRRRTRQPRGFRSTSPRASSRHLTCLNCAAPRPKLPTYAPASPQRRIPPPSLTYRTPCSRFAACYFTIYPFKPALRHSHGVNPTVIGRSA
jgi:hypothetical protein